MLKVGITGGIGSGKTTVCRLFETLHIPIYYSDDTAKYLLQHDKQVRQAVMALFGKIAYLPDGTYNKKEIAAIVFKDPLQLKRLENIVHPAVWQHSEQWLVQIPPQTPYIIKESALLFETGAYKQLDQIIVVSAPLELRLERVKQRDKQSDEQIKARIAQQLPDIDKISLANFVIYNDEKQLLIPQVIAIHRQLVLINKNFGANSTI